MQAIILAGGKGTRLGELTREIPKPMIPVGGKPLIEHQITLLKKNNITNIIVTVGHLDEKIIEFVESKNNFDVSISFYREIEPLGTAGAIPLLHNQLESQFLVLYGDVMMDVDLNKLINFHKEKKADITLVVHPNDHPYDSDLVEINSNKQVTKFLPKPHQNESIYKNLVNAGLYMLDKKAVSHIPKRNKIDFGKDIFPALCNKLKMFSYNTPEYLKDMGTPDRLTDVEKDYSSGKIQRKNLSFPQKAIFLDRDGVLNEDRHLIYKIEDLVLYDFTSEAIKKINHSDFLSIVVTNQSVVARNLCTIEELENIHKKLDTDLSKDGAKLDAIYYCPYHPDKGYPEENKAYKKDHPCRKPKPGMLLEAAKDFNIDLSKSYIIGDRSTDIEAGKNAGVSTIGVLTGNALKSGDAEPDYIFDNIATAIEFVLSEPLDKIYKEVSSIHSKSASKPFVIAAGGQSQSGKTTLATYLKKRFVQDGFPTLVISLDNWLLPSEQRKKANDVWGRFNIDKINEDIEAILNGDTVHLQAYHKNPASSSRQVNYKLENEPIVIIEGVVSLNIDKIIKRADYSYFTKININQYKNQFYKLYRWKGYEDSEIKMLFNRRLDDEFEPVEPTMSNAKNVISIL
ncbi:HAD-IIIA family hydrolase [Ekhidna sp.]|uniref:HAD-IIIA family hydrolase n=1 Tax=Ekhidna sp. TaxID=2608089 RepID=UPI003298167B